MNTRRKITMKEMGSVVRHIRLNGISAPTEDGDRIDGVKIILIHYFTVEQNSINPVDFTYMTIEGQESYAIEQHKGSVVAKKIPDNLLSVIKSGTVTKVTTLFSL